MIQSMLPYSNSTRDLLAVNTPLDITLLYESLKKTGMDEIVGSVMYLTELMEETITSANIEYPLCSAAGKVYAKTSN